LGLDCNDDRHSIKCDLISIIEARNAGFNEVNGSNVNECMPSLYEIHKMMIDQV